MKPIRIILLFSFFWLCLAAVAAPPAALEQQALQLINAFREGSATQRQDLFNPQMQQFLQQQDISEIWTSLEDRYGSFSSISHFIHEQLGEFQAVIAHLELEKGGVGLRLIFEESGLIAGMQYVPATVQNFTPSPSYADSLAFSEQPMLLDCGDIRLPAMLSMPHSNQPVPVVVLVHGSGPNDMDETIGPNKVFRDIAHGLASKGIAVLRYEKRTKNFAHTLDLDTTTPWEEAGHDAVKAIEAAMGLQGIDPGQVYLLGHSLGGILAPAIAEKASGLQGIIILAGASSKLYDLVLEQFRYLGPIQDPSMEQVGPMIQELEEQVARIHNGELKHDSPREHSIMGQNPSYWLYFKEYEQVKMAASLPQKILVLQAERDYQVPMKEFFAWRSGLAAHKKSTFKWYPGLNHLFIHGTGAPNPSEYFNPGNVSEKVITDIADWINRR